MQAVFVLTGMTVGVASYWLHSNVKNEQKRLCDKHFHDLSEFNRAHAEWVSSTSAKKQRVFSRAETVLKLCRPSRTKHKTLPCLRAYNNWEQMINEYRLDYHEV